MISMSTLSINGHLEELEDLSRELLAIRKQLSSDAKSSAQWLEQVDPKYRDSAANLLHYLSLRKHDLRKLQKRLAAQGLSSLGRAESHVLSTLDAVLRILHGLTEKSSKHGELGTCLSFETGEKLLSEHAESLLGPPSPGRDVRIMVTVPSSAASSAELVYELLKQGMNCMRINCAHDDAAAWLQMIEHLRTAEQKLNRRCKIFMDLSGPKLRTGPIEPRPSVARIRPKRDAFGSIVRPARVWLSDRVAPPTEPDAALYMDKRWLATLEVGDSLCFVDARGSNRSMLVLAANADGVWAECDKSAYIVPGLAIKANREVSDAAHSRKKQASRQNCTQDARGLSEECTVDGVPAVENYLILRPGDRLHVFKSNKTGQIAGTASDGTILTPASIGCTLPESLDNVRTGQTIWFDDGKIGGLIEKILADRIIVRIFQARDGGSKLRSDKGINLPETEIHLEAMTAKDVEDLAFVAQHADVVELSFANSARDIEILEQHLRELGDRKPGIVIKVETNRGFKNLPEMLLTAMKWPNCGVMIARGDLAIEVGFERLAEVQEEILWICEAGHIPVIWATQVLENLAQTGIPSRAEISDAVMGNRAECVMLNKGPYISKAVRLLDNILHRMQSHQEKKSSRMRILQLAKSPVTSV